MKNPFEQYRAFSAYLVAIPKVDAMRHLWKCFSEGGKNNMAFYLADFYQVEPYRSEIKERILALQTIVDRLHENSKNYDLSGFKFIGKEGES